MGAGCGAEPRRQPQEFSPSERGKPRVNKRGKRHLDELRRKIYVMGLNVIVLGKDNFTSRHRLAIALFAEGQHLGGAGDDQPLQDALDNFIDEYIGARTSLSDAEKRAIFNLPAHFGTTKRQRPQ